ncbi:hypothetical protein CROQUDRAFT_667052 [Cronartium quercuum f. sp. fusiforme G11]|uniref:Uncharacterized protein n=1 Tax=Cronartium quercuum f. sp. fusiforme G11 TaxID=708437 RepID=A0A9P6T634_9BASI|nr:hypothetical protein CROQUDRAFT_667052 [Cronartium quercuum f. sp. fusiforme G11]
MDDTYSNKSWVIVGQGLFELKELNRMERELFSFLGLNCCVGGDELEEWCAEWCGPERRPARSSTGVPKLTAPGISQYTSSSPESSVGLPTPSSPPVAPPAWSLKSDE